MGRREGERQVGPSDETHWQKGGKSQNTSPPRPTSDSIAGCIA